MQLASHVWYQYFWYHRSGDMIFEHAHSGKVGILGEGREITANSFPTSQSNGYALVCNCGSGPRTASSPREASPLLSLLLLPSSSAHIYILGPLLFIVPALQPSHEESIKWFSFSVLYEGCSPCWRQMAEALRCHTVPKSCVSSAKKSENALCHRSIP